MSRDCPSCTKKVSEKAFDCPHCGHPLRKPRRGFFGVLFKWSLILFNVLMIVWVVAGLGGAGEIIDNAGSEAEASGAAIGTAIGLTAILIIWVLGNIILGLPTILTRPRK